MEKDPLTEKIIAGCFEVHNELGAGFKESVYHNALKIALEKEGLKFETEKTIELEFQGKKVGKFRLDLIVENKVVVEVKSMEGYIPDVFKGQILSYLKASGLSVGLLINFGNKSCYIKRFVV